MIYTSKCHSWKALNTQEKVDAAFTPTWRARFWSNVDDSGECWEWRGLTYEARGYGRTSITINKRCIGLRAHRASWMMARGPIPPDIHVCHKCDNVLCVNPAHLFLATNHENRIDCAVKERTRGPYGGTKLTADLVMEIRNDDSGKTDTEWAREIGVHPTTVYNARIGKKWTHLPMPGESK